MTLFELAEPRSLNEAVALLDPDDASVRPIAGGTALMLMMKAAVFRPSGIVSLRKSRSVLAERFARFLGEPPLSYLARWRLQLAGRKLQTTQQTILPDHLG
jgi:carbon-monoxide dehydrogenase medium subunit